MTGIENIATELTADETALAAAFRSGQRAIFSEENRPEIRAEVILGLLFDPASSQRATGLRIRNAIITGSFDLQGANLGLELSFSNCSFERSINLINARARDLF